MKTVQWQQELKLKHKNPKSNPFNFWGVRKLCFRFSYSRIWGKRHYTIHIKLFIATLPKYRYFQICYKHWWWWKHLQFLSVRIEDRGFSLCLVENTPQIGLTQFDGLPIWNKWRMMTFYGIFYRRNSAVICFLGYQY